MEIISNLFKPKAKVLREIKNGEAIAPVTYKGKECFIDTHGEVVMETPFKDVTAFSEGLSRISIDGKIGFMNKHGDIAIKPVFDEASLFFEGVAFATIYNTYRPAVKKGSYGYIDRIGEWSITPRFKSAKRFSEGLAAVVVMNQGGVINKESKFVIGPRLSFASTCFNGRMWVKYKDDSDLHVVDNEGNWLYRVKTEFDTLGQFVSEISVCGIEDSIIAFDMDMHVLFQIDDVESFRAFNNGLCAVKIGGKYGYINPVGEFVIPCSFQNAYDFSKGLAAVMTDGLYCFIDTTGKIVIPAKFTDTGPFNDLESTL